MNNTIGKYDCSIKSGMNDLLRKLRMSRREKRVYVTAGILTVIYQKIGLTEDEKLDLRYGLNKARFGNLPLIHWLPRGYQIARFLLRIKEHDPRSWGKPTQRDIKLIREAAVHYGALGDSHSKRQLTSLTETCKAIGVII